MEIDNEKGSNNQSKFAADNIKRQNYRTKRINKLKELDVWVDDHIEYDDQNQEVRKKIMEAFTSSNII